MNLKENIWKAALNYLKLRPHSKKELHDKLRRKFPNEDGSIETALDEMQRVQLINDQRFTEEFVSHLTQKNIGRFKLFGETRKKGLSNEKVEQALLDQNWVEEEVIKRAIEEKKRVLGEMDKRKLKQKLVSFLQNRGFTNGVIFKALED